jgi:hypothetical protein
MKKIVIAAMVAGLIVWPGIPLAKFYGPYLIVFLVNGPGR